MSRVGKKPISVPDKVKIKLEKRVLFAEGPKGKSSYELPFGINIDIKDSVIQLFLDGSSSDKRLSAMFGTARARISNMIEGVVNEFSKVLEIKGVGYKGSVQGQKLILHLGFSHTVEFDIPAGMTMKFDAKSTILTLTHFDKEVVGNMAAKIRRMKPTEPYKGTGIRYQGEYVIRKAGKTAAGVGTGTGAGAKK
ncbi:MAG: 50S ribosomal protein L6 [Elusimicrobia bacterium]|nr:50S ribosomal protein L6 [Elusimicrobiota bacterium]